MCNAPLAHSVVATLDSGYISSLNVDMVGYIYEENQRF